MRVGPPELDKAAEHANLRIRLRSFFVPKPEAGLAYLFYTSPEDKLTSPIILDAS